MKNNLYGALVITTFFMEPYVYANEFIVHKKTKKEIAAHVKEDIIELLESSLRQLGKNIQHTVAAQNKIFDQIKTMCDNSSQSTEQLKELRAQLEKYLRAFEQQQAELGQFLLQIK